MTIEHIELTEAYEATPAALADVAAEAIRALNHATFPGKERLIYPSNVYDVTGSLHRVVAMLDQSLEQLAGYLEREDRQGRVVADYGGYSGNTAGAIGAYRGYVAEARTLLAAARDSLGFAHVAAAGLSAVEDEAAAPGYIETLQSIRDAGESVRRIRNAAAEHGIELG